MRLRWTLPISCWFFLSLYTAADVAGTDNQLCIIADNVIDSLYVNGQERTSELANRKSAKKCDCIRLPVNTTTIALKATNLGGLAGILACRSLAKQGVYDRWRCVDARKVVGQRWYDVGYNNKWWRQATKNYEPHRHPCLHWRRQPCLVWKTWFWGGRQSIRTVICRIEYCDSNCGKCDLAAMGKCNPGACMQGSATLNGTLVPPVNGAVTCQHKCCLEVKAWDPSQPANGYIKVTDNTTGTVNYWNAADGGRYLATIDMASCSIVNRNYRNWNTAGSLTAVLNTWNDPMLSPDFSYEIAVDLAVGGDSSFYAPWIDIWQLGIGEENSLYGSTDHSHYFRACLQGANNADVQFTDVELVN